MKRVFRTVLLPLLALYLLVAVPSRAQADMFRFWAEGRGDVFSGSSDVFSELDSPFGGGLEVGLEVIEISLIGELLAMAGDWWLYTLHLGLDFDFGEEDAARFMFGFYTGIMVFEFPELPPKIDWGVLTPEQQERVDTVICANRPSPCDGLETIESELNKYSDLADQFSGWAFGYNIIRLRLSLDYPVAKVFYIGLAAQIGYHLIVTGEEVVAEGKNQAVDKYAAKYDWSSEDAALLREAVHAEPLGDLDGLNYGIHIYFRFEVGT